ncbi:MAG: uroporphyrinogen decarboxylase family protein [Promethearchaeota archaeon]
MISNRIILYNYSIKLGFMNARERYLAVFEDKARTKLDRVSTHVQYTREEFINKYKDEILENYSETLFYNYYFDIPLALGFDSVFAPFPSSYKTKLVKIRQNNGKYIRIKEDGQAIRRKTPFYEGGYIHSIDILDDIHANIKKIDNSELLKKTLRKYEQLAPKIFPVLTVDGIFDKVWKSMGMVTFSRNFRKNTHLYKKLIKFYAKLAKLNIEGLIDATGERGKVVTLLDDVAFKGRSMISKERWNQDFLPYYKEINSIIIDSNMIPQIHTDGDPTELIPSFQEAGFQGLQGWEGGANPQFINEKYPNFVVIGFGDVSHILPYGDQSQVIAHVKSLMDIFKENKHFILGPSTVIFKEIPLKNVITFINAARKYGKY